MPNDFLNKPFTRDTTPNSPREILTRFCLLVFPLSGVLALLLGALAWVQRDPARLRHAAGCAAVFLLLLATRRWWRGAPAIAPAAVPAVPASRPIVGPSGHVQPPSAASFFPATVPTRPRILLLNASLAGPAGNSARLIALLTPRLAPHADLVHATLAGPAAATFATLDPALRAADAFVIATGTHWDSWSSPLQRFLEDATPAEATELWLGKPAAVLVTEHSTGGKGVLSRLQGVLLTLGCALPPLTGLVLSHAGQLARQNAPAAGAADDLWRPADLDVVAHNLLAAARLPRPAYRAWAVDRAEFAFAWLEP